MRSNVSEDGILCTRQLGDRTFKWDNCQIVYNFQVTDNNGRSAGNQIRWEQVQSPTQCACYGVHRWEKTAVFRISKQIKPKCIFSNLCIWPGNQTLFFFLSHFISFGFVLFCCARALSPSRLSSLVSRQQSNSVYHVQCEWAAPNGGECICVQCIFSKIAINHDAR